MLFAQAVPAIPGAGEGLGIMSVVIQGGALSLLAYVIVYLAPRLLREEREERALREKEYRAEREARDDKFERIVSSNEVKFEQRSAAMVTSINDQTRVIAGSIERQNGVFVKSLEDSATKITSAVVNTCKHKPA